MHAVDERPRCPCGTGEPYAECCEPAHLGGEPPDAESLVRARYAAYALGRRAFLWRTLHADHDDRGRSEEAFLDDLARTSKRLRYRGLRVIDRAPPDRDGVASVLFVALVRDRGRDASFAERSSFVHDGAGWRYVAGVAVPAEGLDLDGLTLERFDAWLRRRR